ncbi:hypothetical protein BYI23_E001220 (plasmid) [Burkholderia sp. YI23]|nr:hypothetical protein BYI23_E001220 [Burkholderia sp. YI23]
MWPQAWKLPRSLPRCWSRGSLGMLALVLPWVLLFAPTGVALVRQASSLIDRYHRLGKS